VRWASGPVILGPCRLGLVFLHADGRLVSFRAAVETPPLDEASNNLPICTQRHPRSAPAVYVGMTITPKEKRAKPARVLLAVPSVRTPPALCMAPLAGADPRYRLTDRFDRAHSRPIQPRTPFLV